MIDVTKEVTAWVSRCQALQVSDLIKDEAALFAAEEACLKELLLRRFGAHGKEASELINAIEVEYLGGINEVRQLCIRQQSGNIYCAPKKVEILSGSRHEIRSIDPRGTMAEIGPYVEVLYERGFILEPVRNLRFWIKDQRGVKRDGGN